MNRPFAEYLRTTGLPEAAVRRYVAQHDAAQRALDADGAPREPRRTWVVPGRVEVLGKHVDYAGGRSLLCAADRGLVIVALPRADRTLHVLDAVRQGAVTVSLENALQQRGPRGWSVYPGTVARRLVRNFGQQVHGTHLAIASALPSAAGLSSSSALTVGIALAISEISGLSELPEWREAIPDRLALAGYIGAMENGFRFGTLAGEAGVGTMGGAQDHTAILCSAASQLGVFRWAPGRHERWVAWPHDWVFVIAVSGVVASKAGAARTRYNRAARTVRHLVDAWNLHTQRDDATLGGALDSSPEARGILEQLAESSATREFSAEHLLARVRQFVDETDVYVPSAAAALHVGDMAAFGTHVRHSQAGAEVALENQVPETVFLAASAYDAGAVAASSFGAGFGGSVWAMVRRDEADEMAARWRAAYRAAFPDGAARASWLQMTPAPPAMDIPADALAR